LELEQKVAIVTGAGRGLGRGIAEGLLERNMCVAAVDREPIALAELGECNPRLRTYLCNVTEPEAIASCVQEIYEDMGDVDCLINNAGRIFSAPFINPVSLNNRKHSFEDWRSVLNSNLNSVFCMTIEIADRMTMVRKKGVIVNISSISARGNAGQCAYSAAKAGVEAFTKTVAKELGPWGIRVVAVAPGFMDTPSTREAMNEKVLEEWKRHAALRRMGSVGNVVSTVLHAIENDFLTGCVLPVDGGVWI
jgi:3-oxoacyl-[acyl-carrier protein] reductase